MPTRRITELFGIELPIVQAPMAGAHDQRLAIAVALAGGLGSLPCALLQVDAIRMQVRAYRAKVARKPLNLNFFCHETPKADAARDGQWRDLLAPYYTELGVDAKAPAAAGSSRAPFDEASCALVEELSPEVVSFHFGLPTPELLERVRRTGAKIVCSATTVAEAQHLEGEGCDVIIAQGSEAGGHRGMFLSDDVGTQVGTLALVPQVVDAVRVPVLASGGITDARGVAAALALGACGVQVGTAYLRCPESTISALHRAALATASDEGTRLTTLFSGRPARGIENRLMRELGSMPAGVPHFPLASAALAPLRTQAEAKGSSDFTQLWAGQAAALAREVPAGDLTRQLMKDAMQRLRDLAG
jgi:nitronate monooxygenase